MLLSLGVSFVMSALRSVVKNPSKRAELKYVMLRVFEAIRDAFSDDPDFQ